MAEPMLVGAFELFWTQAGGDDRQRVCFMVEQGNRQPRQREPAVSDGHVAGRRTGQGRIAPEPRRANAPTVGRRGNERELVGLAIAGTPLLMRLALQPAYVLSRLSRSAGHGDKDARSSVKDAASSAMSFNRNCSSNVEMIGKPVELI